MSGNKGYCQRATWMDDKLYSYLEWLCFGQLKKRLFIFVGQEKHKEF